MRIELSNVEFRYGRELILHHLNVRIPAGSFTLLCGQTGSGKSTLLQLIAGLESPTGGTIRYMDAAGKEQQSTRERTSIVFQIPETQLFASTVQQEIEYGLELRRVPKRERLPLVEKALLRVGVEPAEFLERSPFLLSGGEKRRVVIAAALVLEPQILILDEPTAGLDPSACRELLQVLTELHENGLTIVVATHDLDSFFPLADQVVIMRHGQAIYAGHPEQLLQQPEFLQSADLEMPSLSRIAHVLREKGVRINVPLTVEEFLQSLEKTDLNPAGVGVKDDGFSSCAAGLDDETDAQTQAAVALQQASGQLPKSLLHHLDPRAKWFAMVLLSLASLGIANGWGVAAAFLTAAVLFRAAGVSLHRVWSYLRPFLVMFAFLFAVSAVTFQNPDWSLGPVGIGWHGALSGGLGIARFLLVILLGLLFTETTTGAPLREGFEWAIRPLRKIGVPTRDLSLAVSITLQFVPWIFEKVGQLQKSLIARGQDRIGVRKWSPRQISILIVPLLIMLLKMGDELATAIESRGYNREVERTAWHKLQWTAQDSVACGLTATVAGLIWWLG